MAMQTFRMMLFLLPIAVASLSAEAEDCPGSNQLENNQCAAFSFNEADAELNKLYKEQINRLKTPKIKERLRDSQRAWVTFRDKACLYEAGLAEESGSIWPLDYYGCMERQTKKRIADLNDYLACTTDDCPH